MSNRRGCRNHRDDDEYSYGNNPDYYNTRDYDDDYYQPRPPPRPTRKRSLSRKVLDKLESAMGGLGLDDASSRSRHHQRRRGSSSRSSSSHTSDDHDYSTPRSPRRRHRSRGNDRYYPPSSSRRYHSSSPPRHRNDGRCRHRSSSRGRTASTSSSGYPDRPRASERSRSRWERGLKAAVEAGAAEAFRLRKEPGPWRGPKAGRIATAAVSAGVIRGAADHHHDRKEDGGGGGSFGPLGSAVGGMLVNRLINGPRKEVRRR
ncbi:hypothetical protein C7999DRAFT_30232 [Corynascus novoguineensis]|uniref:Uncharacterized protein n=1 Tax=Corynascus novoguineensis TaxID=1126955 RepID=A0AAN7CVW4_9PEZI|nr:hypothetical protein C7999DRAFT_30232 [Corynascus novoguineensis]